ncbi:hypothetical protein HAX54_014295 [Datura stramonium]|uniref:Uncharacterized protein n=1 Tax=Datura stramonium TaxID=4076 RepID=A0ABS8TMX1_DATST|nr:hypothetical protein [Datura stramonium]
MEDIDTFQNDRSMGREMILAMKYKIVELSSQLPNQVEASWARDRQRDDIMGLKCLSIQRQVYGQYRDLVDKPSNNEDEVKNEDDQVTNTLG